MTQQQPQKPAQAPNKSQAQRPNPNANRAQRQQKPNPQDKKADGAQDRVTGLATVLVRNEFYKDGYRSLLKIAIFEAFAIALLVITLIFVIMTSNPENRYFATTADGRLVRMVPLNQPNLSDAALLSWVAQAATETMTFGFHDYKRRLQDSSQYFTRRGWESFTKALQSSRIIEAVEARQQVISAVPGSAPVIVQEGIINNQYRWVVEMPLVVTYKSGSSSRPDSMMVRLTIVRVPTLDNPSGVGIEQWIAGGGR
ncbi:MAG: type IV secretion protein IcmL [Rickettsiales bacterium]|nr:type IV secretion protein IcmL [Rickettsiales bacterium]